MADGNGVIYLAIVLAVLGIAVTYLRLKTLDERLIKVAQLISVGLFLVVTGMMLFLYYLFMTTDVSYQYVWNYTEVGAEMKYRVSGTIAGLAGSLLFWVWMIAIPWLIEEYRAFKGRVDPAVLDWTRIFTFATIGVLLYVLSLYEPFAATDPSALVLHPEGQGLNPLLQTDLMVVHPPVVFFAYGFMVLPFAAAFAYLITHHRDWVRISMFWSRAGWLFLTIGIALGGVWAYTTLGWGGYWGWDPVETGSLLPWLLLSGFLHAQLMYKRKGEYPLLAPLLGIFSFILIIFATFATRAGGLWVSVHTFDQANTDIGAWDRFMDILEHNPSVRVYVMFMIVTTALAIILALRIYLRREKEEEQYFTLAELIDDGMLMFAAISLFILTTVVTMLILLGGVNGLSADNFNTPVGLLSLAGMLVLLLCLVWRDWGRKRVAQMAGVAILVGIVAGMVLDNTLAAFAAPILLVSLVGTGYKVVKSFNRRRALPSLGLVGAHLIHLSVVLILIGYVGSTLLVEETDMSLVVDGPEKEFGGYTFKATNLVSDPDSIFVDVEVWKGDRFLEKARPGAARIKGQVRSEVAVVSTLSEDVYLVYHNATTIGGSNVVNLGVKVLPLMSVLWTGMVLMWVGITIRMVAEPLAKRRRQARLVDGEPEEVEDEDLDKDRDEDLDEEEEGDEEFDEDEGDEGSVDEDERDDSYYEDLLEEELKRI